MSGHDFIIHGTKTQSSTQNFYTWYGFSYHQSAPVPLRELYAWARAPAVLFLRSIVRPNHSLPKMPFGPMRQNQPFREKCPGTHRNFLLYGSPAISHKQCFAARRGVSFSKKLWYTENKQFSERSAYQIYGTGKTK
ncbi:MAG: hypothetical protein HDT27_00680 [Subdoligranulum sp.]|nr:hypothetical protein [Subdoligranulum sp.]